MKTIFTHLLILSGLLSLTGCFDFLNTSNKSSTLSNTESTITAAQFSGVSSVINKTSGILVGWQPVTDVSLVKSYRVYRVSGNTKVLIASLAPSLTSFMDGTVTPGAIYTYAVHAVDLNNIEDSNSKTLKCLSWAGIESVVADSRSSLIVTLKAETSVVDEVRVYGQLSVGGAKTLLATGTGSDLKISLTSLRTGFPYIITAQAYVNALAKEDGNDVEFTASTYTQGYDADGADQPQWANVMAIRAFGEAPAAPAHPLTPDKSPKDRVVELAFNAFNGAPTNTKYVVTRAINGFTMNTSVATPCTDTTVLSCRACDDLTAASGVVNCRDTNVAASPARYRYSLSLVQTDGASGDTWIEPLPTDSDALEQVSVLVPIPPKNMVLTQRDAANFEMCGQFNKAPDPFNHNRCVYVGIGAVPYSSGNNKPALNLSTGYYDFGYSLFVDRWQMACNWTTADNGGMCGANHSSGNCLGYDTSSAGEGVPTGTVGKVGDIWYRMTRGVPTSGNTLGVCYVATAAATDGTITWLNAGSLAQGTALLQKVYTSDPGYLDNSGNYNLNIPGKRAKMSAYVTAQSSYYACSASVDSSYGAKRLPRGREHVVFEAPAILPGEPYSLGSYANFTNSVWVNNGSHPNSSSYYGCERGVAADIQPSSYAEMLDYTNHPQFKDFMAFQVSSGVYNGGINTGANFAIGATATVDCQSRYGVQDILDGYITSDAFYFDSSTLLVTGVMSPYDNGNRDMLSTLSGLTSGYVVNINGWSGGASLPFSYSTYLKGFIPALGLPILNSSFSSDYWTQAQIASKDNYGLSFIYSSSVVLSGVKFRAMRSRWGSIVAQPATGLSSAGNVRGRCVLPAE